MKRFCPACMLMLGKELTARDAGVTVDELEAPVFSNCRRVGTEPAGSTLVAASEGSRAFELAGPLVCVVTATVLMTAQPFLTTLKIIT